MTSDSGRDEAYAERVGLHRFQGRRYQIANADDAGVRRVFEGATFVGTFHERDGVVDAIHPDRESDRADLEGLAHVAMVDGLFTLGLSK